MNSGMTREANSGPQHHAAVPATSELCRSAVSRRGVAPQLPGGHQLGDHLLSVPTAPPGPTHADAPAMQTFSQQTSAAATRHEREHDGAVFGMS